MFIVSCIFVVFFCIFASPVDKYLKIWYVKLGKNFFMTVLNIVFSKFIYKFQFAERYGDFNGLKNAYYPRFF